MTQRCISISNLDLHFSIAVSWGAAELSYFLEEMWSVVPHLLAGYKLGLGKSQENVSQGTFSVQDVSFIEETQNFI